jgi:hypothetical protein
VELIDRSDATDSTAVDHAGQQTIGQIVYQHGLGLARHESLALQSPQQVNWFIVTVKLPFKCRIRVSGMFQFFGYKLIGILAAERRTGNDSTGIANDSRQVWKNMNSLAVASKVSSLVVQTQSDLAQIHRVPSLVPAAEMNGRVRAV